MTRLVALTPSARALLILLVLFSGSALSLAEESPFRQPHEILGIRPAMPRAEAKKRLEEIGKFVRDERKRQEIWEVRDAFFSHLIVGFDKEDTLRYVTATAREDKEAKRVPYRAIGSLEAARQAGSVEIKNFNYEWELPAEKGMAKVLISARGRDPEFLSSLSLKRLDDGVAADAKAPAP